MRLRDETGRLVKVDELEQDSFATVFPESSPGSADGQAVLIRVDPTALQLPPDRADGAPDGYVCYSKVCTHLGCPIGLYLAADHELRCPCHQSTFDVLNGAIPVYGPADRPLPQLLLDVDDEGYLVAQGDFTGPVGPGFWTIEKGPEGTGTDPL
jgi:ubiquinol-cytochrome c reductase iron-sulfur subunit